MSTASKVRFFFYKDHLPGSRDTLQRLMALAHQTVTDKRVAPTSILIRSGVHATPLNNGRIDPSEWHITICYKTRDHLLRKTHVACHGYVKHRDSLEFAKSSHAVEKPDSCMKSNGRAVWPSEDELQEIPRKWT
ncbi:hypothetical protein BO71DRAFT_5459 [Aspergillus ellipticus CBS 707.79]|uniref:Uncharacterized protein n=1 Tax=Aspergillus ellipticus CBS 707.79 TaxID=1448320 RepID=A0A319EQP0_9EURO|nr:hypothetical protein BO71DRAFT_5459 [Aspergillus ellipticus CBS 707.79]